MKTLKILFLLFLTTIFAISCTNDDIVSNLSISEDELTEENQYFNNTIGEGPYVYFDDMEFKEILLNDFDINTNKDNEISLEEATLYEEAIDVSFNSIKSLTGIEKFVNITALNFANNNVSTLDLSTNINLKYLDCGNNPFYEINLEANTKLTHLDIRTTNISTLDLSQNTNLMVIRGMCNYNLKSVNLNNNNNAKIVVFFFSYKNTHLECVQVDNIDYSNSATNWFISPNAKYSLNCFDNIE
jgi:hypothetical protein